LSVVVLAAVVVERHTARAFTLGVVSSQAVATLPVATSVCQRPIDVPEDSGFDRVQFVLGTSGRPGPPVAVTVRSLAGQVLARGRLAAGYADITDQPSHTVGLDRAVAGGRRIVVCLANRGRRPVAVYGNADAAARNSTAYVAGRPISADIDLRFAREPRSLASLAGTIAHRASLFRPPIVGAWTYVVVALLVVALVPVLLARALAATVRDDRDHR
jgi:hypothetical protein